MVLFQENWETNWKQGPSSWSFLCRTLGACVRPFIRWKAFEEVSARTRSKPKWVYQFLGFDTMPSAQVVWKKACRNGSDLCNIAFLLWCKSQAQGHGTFWNKSWSTNYVCQSEKRHSTSKESCKKIIRAIQNKKTSYKEGRCEDWGSSYSRGRDHIS